MSFVKHNDAAKNAVAALSAAACEGSAAFASISKIANVRGLPQVLSIRYCILHDVSISSTNVHDVSISWTKSTRMTSSESPSYYDALHIEETNFVC